MGVREVPGREGYYCADHWIGEDRFQPVVKGKLTAELLILHSKANLTPATEFTTRAVATWFIDNQSKQIKSFGRQRSIIEKHFIGHFGDTPATAIGKTDLAELRKLLSKRVAPASVRGYFGTFQQLLDAAVERGIIAENPIYDLKTKVPARAARKRIEFPPLDYLEQLRQSAPIVKLTALDLMVEAGVASDELIELRWPDVDLVSRTITISRHLSRDFGPGEMARPQRERIIDGLSDRLVATLQRRRYLALRAGTLASDDRVVGLGYTWHIIGTLQTHQGQVRPRDKELRMGEKRRASRAARIAKRTEGRARQVGKQDLGRYPPACLRHMYALKLCDQGKRIKEIQRLMGFSDARTVDTLYGDYLRERDTAPYAAKVGKALAALMAGLIEVDGDDEAE